MRSGHTTLTGLSVELHTQWLTPLFGLDFKAKSLSALQIKAHVAMSDET
jgi:hypothetical protein